MSDTLTPRQQFKVAFVARCIDRGMDFEQMLQAAERLEKQADLLPIKVKDVTDTLKSIGIAGLAAPPILGAGVGYALGQIPPGRTVEEPTTKQVKKMERLVELQRQTDRLRRMREARERRDSRPYSRY